MTTPDDPLRRFHAIKKRQDPKFEAGEHAWLGHAGLVAACASLNIDPLRFDALARAAGDVEYTYGELVALSGDFYGSPEELYAEEPSLIPWLWEDNDISDLRKEFEQELLWIEREKRGATVAYPADNVALAWNAKSFRELALKNVDHFGWHNVVAYCRHHRAALDFAVNASATNDHDPTWIRALFYNAFADHFLTDGFAAGHVRVPRAEIIAWAEATDRNDNLSGALSKLLHDQDGHVATFHNFGETNLANGEGLHVRNSAGKEWYTRCDGQLFIVDTRDQLLITEPVEAVKASLLELFEARAAKKQPEGIFAALMHVPFPHPQLPGLSIKFNAGMSDEILQKLVKSTAWFQKVPFLVGLDVEHTRALLTELPKLMEQMNANVRREYQASPQLQLRVPRAYVEAYQALR